MLGLFLASTALSVAVGAMQLLAGDAEEAPAGLGRLETWVLFLLGFGLMGAPMAMLGLGALTSLVVAVVSGCTLGAISRPLFAESPPPPSLTDAAGQEARVLLPVCGARGRVVVESLAGRLELPARSVDGAAIAVGRRVLVAFVERGVAHVLDL